MTNFAIRGRRAAARHATQARCRSKPPARSGESHECRERRTLPPRTDPLGARVRRPADGSSRWKWGGYALALWLATFFGYLQLPTRFYPLAWHEMLLALVMAAVAGFLPTAIPDWTGRPPIRGYPLPPLAGLWLLGFLAALARVCASWRAKFIRILFLIAGACWIAAIGLFEPAYCPMLTRPPKGASEAP